MAELTFDEPIAIEAGSAFGILHGCSCICRWLLPYDRQALPMVQPRTSFWKLWLRTDFVGYPGIGFPDPEWTIQMSFVADEEPCTGDLNGDGEVGFSDLQLILSAWETSTAGDANGDGVTNFSDLQVILSAWGGC